MALSNQLAQAGYPPMSVQTTAEVHLERTDSGFAITRIDLSTVGDVPGISAADFDAQAQAAKAGCPVSKALAAVEITLDARLA
jgi:osmotically inducible protein OsmC